MNHEGGVDMNAMGKEQQEREKGLVKSGIQVPDLGKLAQIGRREALEERVVPMSEDDQCFELARTVKCRLAPSPTHGVGVFAMRDIKKGERCYATIVEKPRWYKVHPNTLQKHLGDVYPDIYQLILDRWPHVVNGVPFLSPNYDARLISFMNHSDDANYNPTNDLALRDIKAGEELFEDYCVVPNYEKAFPFLAEKAVKSDVHTPNSTQKKSVRGKIGK